MAVDTPTLEAMDTEVPLFALGGKLNTLGALVDSIIRSGYLDMLPPDPDSVENVNILLELCRCEVRKAIELSQLCEERYNAQGRS